MYEEHSVDINEYNLIPVMSIQPEASHTFDLEIEDAHHYILENGIVSHNTISLTVGNNCSSGIEPIFEYQYTRNIRTGKGDETKAEIVRDYACLIWEQLHPGEPLPDYFTTAMRLDPYKGIDIQATIQKYIDHSISKCVGKSSLVQTSTGLQYMYEIVTHKVENTFEKTTLFILNKNGESEQACSTYYNGIKPVKVLTLSNGIQLKATFTHKLYTEKGWVEAQNLVEGQSLYLKTPTNYTWESKEKEQ